MVEGRDAGAFEAATLRHQGECGTWRQQGYHHHGCPRRHGPVTTRAKDNKLRILASVRAYRRKREARRSFWISGACGLVGAPHLCGAVWRLSGAVAGRAASFWRYVASFAGLSFNKWPIGAVVRFLAAPRPRRGPIGKCLTLSQSPMV